MGRVKVYLDISVVMNPGERRRGVETWFRANLDIACSRRDFRYIPHTILPMPCS
jgi:hypothetical protein